MDMNSYKFSNQPDFGRIEAKLAHTASGTHSMKAKMTSLDVVGNLLTPRQALNWDLLNIKVKFYIINCIFM